MNIPVKITLPLLILLKPFHSWPIKIWNLIKRPRLIVKMQCRQFEYKLDNGEKRIYEIPFISVKNRSKNKIKIKANTIRFNGEAYICLMQGDNLYAKHHGAGSDDVIPAETNPTLVYNFYKENWLDVVQGVACLTLEPDQELLFPLRLIGSGLTRLNLQIKKTKLFCVKNKLSFIINNYEYGLNRMDCYKTYTNYLASHTSRYYNVNYL